MTTEPSSTHASQPQSLPRGAACLPCRRRKMRCNAARPFCIQCYNKGKPDDCEYPGDIQGLTRTQMLEENTALLEARIRELENPAEDTIQLLPAPAQLSTLSPPHCSGEIFDRVPASQSSVDFSPPTGIGNTAAADPAAQDVRALVDGFVPYASLAGFFLSIPRFLHSTQNINSTSPMAHPSGLLYDPLLSTACLWGSRLSSDSALQQYEASLVCRSVKLLSSSIFSGPSIGQQGHAIVAVIQAEVLLANYLFSVGRLLEGKYHSGAAAALCISCHLNTSLVPGQSFTRLLDGADIHLATTAVTPPLTDSIAIGERVNAFWTVYALDTSWSTALGYPSSIYESGAASTASGKSMTISTPWPMRMTDYEQGLQIPWDANSRTITGFLHDTGRGDPNRFSPLALRAQAATLFSRALDLASKYSDAMSISGSSDFWHEFNGLNSLIVRFTDNLPSIAHMSTHGPLDTHDILLASVLSRVATIHLHHKFSASQRRSRDMCLQCAQSVVAMTQDISRDIPCLDPIMAILLTTVCQVFVVEMKIRMPSDSFNDTEYIDSMANSLDKVLAAMVQFGVRCPLMNLQAAQVRELRDA